MSDEINDKNDGGTNVADAVSPSGEIEVLDIKRADSSSGRNGGKGGRGQADGACGGEDRRRLHALGDRQAECETAFSDGFMYLYRVFRHASLYSGDRPGGDQHGADL